MLDFLIKRFFAFVVLVLTLAMPGGAAWAETPSELVVLTWSDYMDPGLVEKFERHYKAKVKFVYFEDDDGRDAMMINSDGKGYDLVMLNGLSLDSYQRRGWLAPVDQVQIPNLAHIDPRWRDAFPSAYGYAVPYFWGTIGIAYRADLVSQPLKKWSEFFNPPEEYRDKMIVMATSIDVIGMALKSLGYSANSIDREELEQAEQQLLKQKPFVKQYSYISVLEDSALVTGEVRAVMVFNGDALMLQAHNENIQYVLPEEGSSVWVDYLSVLNSSSRKLLAYDFLNFMNQPEHAAQQAEFVYYATPNQAAEKLLPKEFLEDPVVYPSQQELARSEFYSTLPPRMTKLRNKMMNDLIK